MVKQQNMEPGKRKMYEETNIKHFNAELKFWKANVHIYGGRFCLVISMLSCIVTRANRPVFNRTSICFDPGVVIIISIVYFNNK